ncbi:MAG: carboxypeptidase-like regulatory domain-containing protein [Flavipsychrobacter sp.]|nr:carboxypeptidase-like regulatory domain-containing protein [Flavipsychrobacter sp.]
MRYSFILLVLLLTLSGLQLKAQVVVRARIVEKGTSAPVPFATVRYGAGNQGVIADLDGYFEIPGASSSPSTIEVSCMGYKTLVLPLPLPGNTVSLEPAGKELAEVTVKPPYEKIRRILNETIKNKPANDPDKYDRYRCHIYYKMLADASLPDSNAAKDTSADIKEFKAFSSRQHLLMSETYSIRNWQRPGKLQEDILATRFSGLKKSAFTSVVTDVLPFHAYTDYITLNGKDYHNPVTPGYNLHYRFNLSDELLDGTDTIWVLRFRPKGIAGNSLTGKVYIHSNGFAISRLVAAVKDPGMDQTVRIEQEYKRIPYDANSSRWFPAQLNYVIERAMKADKTPYTLQMTGRSVIDSVSWDPEKTRFDKSHTVRLADGATEHSDSLLNRLRPGSLDAKEQMTYHVIDSLGAKVKADKILEYMRNLPRGRVSVGAVDIDLMRLLSYNRYENIRLGLGLQTNDRILKWASVGGWAGYGFGDKRWKYGGFAEFYFDKYKEFVLRGSYADDLGDPGRIHIAKELDKNYLRKFLLTRVDLTKTYTVSMSGKFGYWNAEVAAEEQQFIPNYNYALRINGEDHAMFRSREASLNLRYAYGERTAPIFGTYMRTDSKYPIWFGKITTGEMNAGMPYQKYIKAVSGILWRGHLNRIGTEHIMLEAGKIWSDGSLPISRLFAGNGFKYDARYLYSLYGFGGIMTLFPYEVYTDRFAQAIFRHDMDWKLYKLESPDFDLSSAPNIALQYGMLYGDLKNAAAHQNIDIMVPSKGYHEAGMLLNNLIRLRSRTYYQSFNIGYFYPLSSQGPVDLEKKGKIVIGASIEL